MADAQPKFETVLMDAGHRFDRLRVPGGWIYRDTRIGAMVFVPEPELYEALCK